MLEKAKNKLAFQGDKLELKTQPRIGLSIIENSSLVDDDFILDLWAGLFASSCTLDGQDDENLIFIDLLKKLTTTQAKIIKYAVESSQKIIHPNGLVTSSYDLNIHIDKLKEITGVKDLYRIDRELDSLSNMGLIGSGLLGGFDITKSELIADITPSYLALSLYIKCQGSSENPNDVYWKNELITKEQFDKENSNGELGEDILKIYNDAKV